MKKLNSLVAGVLLLAGVTATAQNKEQLFFYGFEDNMAAFKDSTAAADSLTVLQYYDFTGSNGSKTIDETWTLMDPIDTLIYLFHGISPKTSRGDVIELVKDETGEHAKTFKKLGGEGGDYYFHYTSGEGDDAQAWEADLFVRGIPTDDYSSYRVVWYQKAVGEDKRMQVELMRGWYNSEKAFSMNGNGSEFVYDTDTEGNEISEDWERVTFMTYFQNDSVANYYMYKGGYWWENSWKKVIGYNEDSTEIVRNFIVQPKTTFMRMSFRGGSTNYFIDDIAVYKSWIGGAEYNGDIIRVDFGYKTNLSDLAKTDPVGIIDAPFENLTITGVEGGSKFEIFPVAAEYHADGYMYIWLDEQVEGYDDVRISYKNPVDDPAVALKYTGSRYPKALDTEWVEAGKYVPDFENEFVLYNSGISAVNRLYTPPTLIEVDPENNSFYLDGAKHRTVTAKFNKEVYIDDADGITAFMPIDGDNKYLTLESYDAKTFTIVFSYPASIPTTLNGDYELYITNAKALEDGSPAEKTILNLRYGAPDADNASIVAFNEAYAKAVAKQSDAKESEVMYNADMADFDALVAKYNGWQHTAPSVYAAAVAEMEAAIKAVDDRISLANSFQKLIDDSELAFDGYPTLADRAEYKNTQEVYNKYKDTNLPTTSTEDLQAIVNDYSAVYSKLSALINGIELRTKQVKGLAKLAEDLGVDFGDQAEFVASELKSNIIDNQELAEVYKQALRGKISEIFAASDSTFDATHFMRNSVIYAEYDEGQANKIKDCKVSPYPGWTIIGGGGNPYCNTSSGTGATVESPVKDNTIGLDWNSNITIAQTLTSLPAGKYAISAPLSAWGSISASTVYGDLIFAQLGASGDTVQLDTLSFSKASSGQMIDREVEIVSPTVNVQLQFGTKSTWCFISNINLTITGRVEGHDYEADAKAAKAALAEAITIVEPVAGAAVETEYYNLNGQRVAAPQRGISIKVSTDANGNRKAEKVLVR